MKDVLANVSEHNELDDTENVGYDLEDNNQVRLALGVMQDYVRHLANGTNNPGITQETAEKIIGKAQDIKDDGLDMLKIDKHYTLEKLRQYHLALNGSSMVSIMQGLSKLVSRMDRSPFYLHIVKPYSKLVILAQPTVGDVDSTLHKIAKVVKDFK